METRVCKQCKIEYELELGFYSTGKDGKCHSTCKNCRKENEEWVKRGINYLLHFDGDVWIREFKA